MHIIFLQTVDRSLTKYLFRANMLSITVTGIAVQITVENYVIVCGTIYSRNMGTCDLPDRYAQSPRAAGICIRQIKSADVTNIM